MTHSGVECPRRQRATAARPPARATYPISGYPRTRAVVWAFALLSGGLGAIVIFFFAIGVIDLSLHPFLGVVAWSSPRSSA